jgi:hypothetical protein
LLDQHLVADALDQALELAVALRAVAQEKQDQRFPLARDDAERGVEPAGEAGTAGLRRRRDCLILTKECIFVLRLSELHTCPHGSSSLLPYNSNEGCMT